MATERRAEVTWQGSLMEGAGTIDRVGSGAFGPLDVTWASRTEDPARRTSPEELIAAAHASCFSMALSHALAQAGTAPERLSTVAPTVTFVPGTGITKIALAVRRPRAGSRRGRLPAGRRGRQGQLPGVEGAGRRPRDHARRTARESVALSRLGQAVAAELHGQSAASAQSPARTGLRTT